MRKTYPIDVVEMDKALAEVGNAEHFNDEAKHRDEGGCTCAIAIRFAEMIEDSKELDCFVEAMVPTIFMGMSHGKDGLKTALQAIFYLGCYIGQQSMVGRPSEEWSSPDEIDPPKGM